MKKRELFELKTGIENLLDYPGSEFGYSLNLNLNVVKEHIKAIEDAKRKPSEKLIAYTEAQIEVIKKYAKKDKDDKFIIENNQNVFDIKNLKDANKEFDKLKLKFGEQVRENEEIQADYNALLDSDFDTSKLEMIPKSLLPVGLTGRQSAPIMVLIVK